MKVLKSWFKEYIDFNLDDQELDNLLTYSGTLVENASSQIDKRVIVVEIKEITKHPHADRLQLAKIFNGQKEQTIVCGATNIAVGQKVPLAQVGTKLPGGEIKAAEIRGIISEGMLCSPKELGLGDDHEGIYILPADYTLGHSLSEYLSQDTVFELEITPNRGDCLSHLGIAREIAANLAKPLPQPDFALPAPITTKDFSVSIEDIDLCPQYHALLIDDVHVAESPKWLIERLVAVGLKPINNLVDITNYIMLDLGQPLHAFDAEKLSGSQIIVRKTKTGESLTTLDNVKADLAPDMLVIADREKPVALAGIVGGLDSGITNNSKNIVLEAAEFNAPRTRATAKKLGLSTDASYRFERGIDPAMVTKALAKAGEMIAEICQGKVRGSVSSVLDTPANPWITIPPEKINDLLNTNFSLDEIKDYLIRLGFQIKENTCQAPSWRHDISLWQDLSEEVVRLYNVNNVKPDPLQPAPSSPSDFLYKEYLKDQLVDLGYTEVINYPFLSPKDVDNLFQHGYPKEDLLEVANPIQQDNKYLRNSLIPGLLSDVAKNPTFDPVTIFEIGHIFHKDSEETHLGICSSGKNADKYLIAALDLIKKYGLSENDYKILSLKTGETFGYKIKKGQTEIIEMNLSPLVAALKETLPSPKLALPSVKNPYRPISKYPPVNRDLAFIVAGDVAAQQIIDSMYQISPSVLLVEIFDEYSSDKLGQNKKNIAFHVYLQDLKSTLTDSKAEEIFSSIIKEIENKYSAQLRV